MTDHFNETAVIPEAVLHGTNSREALADVLSPAPSRSAPQQPVPDLLVQRALLVGKLTVRHLLQLLGQVRRHLALEPP